MFDIVKSDFSKDIFDLTMFKEKEDGKYLAVIDMGEKVKPGDIDITIDKVNNTITVKYGYADNNSKFSSTLVETIPAHANIETIDAELVEGVLTISIDQYLAEAEEYVDTSIPQKVPVSFSDKN